MAEYLLSLYTFKVNLSYGIKLHTLKIHFITINATIFTPTHVYLFVTKE